MWAFFKLTSRLVQFLNLSTCFAEKFSCSVCPQSVIRCNRLGQLVYGSNVA